MVSESTEIASPAAVITAILPEVAPALEIDETGISIVVPFEDVTEMDLLRQNFTVIEPVNPVPVIVNVPPPPRDSNVVERDETDGGKTVDVSKEVTPLRAIPEPLPT
jgi:hypothetical protein